MNAEKRGRMRRRTSPAEIYRGKLRSKARLFSG
jgi:hypothetical protein